MGCPDYSRGERPPPGALADFSSLGGSVSEDLIRLITQICISCTLLFTGLGILVFETAEPEVQKLAAGWVGAVLGYWLR
jgi:hypothetical protein